MLKDLIRTTLRLDNETYEKITIIADRNKRSINKQIDFIIASFIKDYEKFNGEIKTGN